MNAKMATAMEKANKDFEKEMSHPVQTTISSKSDVRGEILLEAGKLITGDRAVQYGNFKDQMTAIAATFNALNTGIKGEPVLEAHHIGQIMQILKLRRSLTATDMDSEIDLCGYTALIVEAFKS